MLPQGHPFGTDGGNHVVCNLDHRPASGVADTVAKWKERSMQRKRGKKKGGPANAG